MINDNTIISSFNDRPTLLEWLKKVEDALKSDTATSFHVNNRGNATLSFSIDFSDGTSLESEPIVLQQGESVIGAEIRSGHLILTLTNGDELDAGDVKPVTSFLINDSQHLIVYYGDGTSHDLGAIFSGNVNIDGNLTANNIVETMTGYSFTISSIFTDNTIIDYAGVCKNGNKITFVISGKITPKAGGSASTSEFINVGVFGIPSQIGQKLIPFADDFLSRKFINLIPINDTNGANAVKDLIIDTRKNNDVSFYVRIRTAQLLSVDVSYLFRYEETFLLSDNMAN